MAGPGAVRPSGGVADVFDELERTVRHLGEELAFFRRRALDAERRVRELAAQPTAPPAGRGAGETDAELRPRVAALEAENADLRGRLAEAAERTRALADRVRFVRQQVPGDEEPA
jgi:hypothetical protein